MTRWMHAGPLSLIPGFGLALGLGLGAFACQSEVPTQSITIQSEATLYGKPARCGHGYALGEASSGFELADARMYLSHIELYDAQSSTWRPLALQDSRWQGQGVALLDFEDASGACADTGTQATNDQVIGELPQGDYVGLRFTIGVPPELNHLNLATAQDPLREAGMFWTWQAGYKFFKVDVRTTSASRYNVHMGAVGCASAAPVLAPTQPCARPNRAQITLFPFNPRKQTLKLELEELLAPMRTSSDDTERLVGCMGDPAQAQHCEPVMQSMGLNPESGTCLNECAEQSLFVAGGEP